MSKVKIQGNASGTGVLTVTAPNTSTDRTITLPDSTGTLATTADSVGGANGVDFNDNVKARFGTGNDFAIWHDGSHTRLQNTTGNFNIRADVFNVTKSDDSEDVIVANADGDIKLYRNNVIHLETLATGVRVPVGGVLFGTDTAAANALDDYEEGTWTVGLRGSATSGNHTYHGRNGYYTKVGNAVHIQGGVHINSIGNLDGNVFVTGLPFTTGTSGSAFSFSYGGGMSINAGTVPVGYSVGGSTEFYIRAWDVTSGVTDLNQSETPSGTQIIFSGTYFV